MGTSAPALSLNTMQFEIVRNVTLPFFIMPEDGTPSFVKFLTAIKPDESSFSERVTRRRKANADGTENKDQKEKMDIANVVNLQTGEEMRLVCHEVLKNIMTETYSDDAYVGKLFRVVKTPKKGGRGGKYYAFDVAEIRLKTENADAPAPPAKQTSRR